MKTTNSEQSWDIALSPAEALNLLSWIAYCKAACDENARKNDEGYYAYYLTEAASVMEALFSVEKGLLDISISCLSEIAGPAPKPIIPPTPRDAYYALIGIAYTEANLVDIEWVVNIQSLLHQLKSSLICIIDEDIRIRENLKNDMSIMLCRIKEEMDNLTKLRAEHPTTAGIFDKSYRFMEDIVREMVQILSEPLLQEIEVYSSCMRSANKTAEKVVQELAKARQKIEAGINASEAKQPTIYPIIE